LEVCVCKTLEWRGLGAMGGVCGVRIIAILLIDVDDGHVFNKKKG
jgi:hypothetical protein